MPPSKRWKNPKGDSYEVPCRRSSRSFWFARHGRPPRERPHSAIVGQHK